MLAKLQKFWIKLRGKDKRYDLPLNRSSGTGFVVWVMSMMVYLATIIVALFFALSAVTARWTDGLALQATLEIPSSDLSGMSKDKQKDAFDKLIARLNGIDTIDSAQKLSQEEMDALIAPWLGIDNVSKEIPLPALVAITLNAELTDTDIKAINNNATEFFANASLDTHKKWLEDMQSLVQSIRFVVLGLGLIIIVTAISSVSGAARSRLAIHRDEVHLLHIMGADDAYIASQFERQSGHLSMVAGGTGFLLAIITLACAALIGSGVKEALLPDYSLSALQWFALVFVPIIGVLVAMVSARITVMRALKKLP